MREYPPGKHPSAKDFTDAGFEVVDDCEITTLVYEKLVFAANYLGHELAFTPYTIEGLPQGLPKHRRIVVSDSTDIDGSSVNHPSVVAVAAPGAEAFIRCLALRLPEGEF